MIVKVRNILWPKRHLYFFPMEQFHVYQGDEVSVKWVVADDLALSTNIPGFSFRVIKRAQIVAIDGKPYDYTSNLPDLTVRIISGSNGQKYQVTGQHKCTCPGFTFRGSCKHLEM